MIHPNASLHQNKALIFIDIYFVNVFSGSIQSRFTDKREDHGNGFIK
jgi:hypothetical protein